VRETNVSENVITPSINPFLITS